MTIQRAVCGAARAAAARRLHSAAAAAAAPGGPLAVYQSRLADGSLYADEYQAAIVQRLDQIHRSLSGYAPPRRSLLTRLFSFGGAAAERRPRGLYLWGTVGTGKTMLMDLFHDCVDTPHKRRVHFNAFMLDVHRRIHEAKARMARQNGDTKPRAFDPIRPVAEAIADEVWLICFDEFQVSSKPGD